MMLLGLLFAFPFGLAPQTDAPSTVQTIYVVEFCHADVGFDAPPSEMAHNNYIRLLDALDLMDVWPTYHWTVETTHQLEGFLQRASFADVQRLKIRLAQGRIALGANYSSLHSANCGEEEMNRLAYAAAKYDALFGHTSRTAFLDDVPGFSTAVPRVLSASGFPYAVLGPNDFIGGVADIPLNERPFWWQGSDGSRTLTWQNYGSYAEGYLDWGLTSLANAEHFIPLRLQEFAAAGYAYDSILVSRAFDNTYPNASMASLAAQWNSTHTVPQIKLATAAQFFDHLLATYGDVFPTYAGDGSGGWDDNTMVTPASTSLVRRSRAGLADLEALRAALFHSDGLSYPGRQLQRAWRRILTFNEHSGGGAGWPGHLSLADVEKENREFVQMATDADEIFHSNLSIALQTHGPAVVPLGEAGLVVYNPLGAAYSGIVEIDTGASQAADLRLAGIGGRPDATFRWLDNQRRTLAVKVVLPARGWARWQVTGGGTTAPPPTWSSGQSVAAGPFTFTVDPITGVATEWLDGANGIDWLRNTTTHPFGGLEGGTNMETFFSIWRDMNPPIAGIEIESAAPLFRRIRVLGPSGGNWIREYRVYEQEARVDVLLRFRRSDVPFVSFANHSLHIGMSFPAALSAPTVLTLDGPDGHYQPETDSLPGAQLAHFGASTGATLRGVNGRWISVSSLDTPTIDVGEISGAAATIMETDETALTWKLIRHHSEAQVLGGAIVPIEVEPGLADLLQYEFKVRVGDSSVAPPSRATQQRDLSPPFANWVPLGQALAPTATGSFLDVSGPATVTCWKRSEDNSGTVLRLRAHSNGGSVTIAPPPFSYSSVWRCDLVERPITPLLPTGAPVILNLAAEEVVTILFLD
jgi:hypothetical protein